MIQEVRKRSGHNDYKLVPQDLSMGTRAPGTPVATGTSFAVVVVLSAAAKAK